MDDLIPKDARRGVVIVAHPDDEALWCGGLLARGDIDWTVVCCSIPHRDPDRAYQFFLSCETLGAKARLLPFGERDGPFRLDLVDLVPFDVILTHGPSGEYGHPHHKAVYDRIAGRWPNRIRRMFGYKRGGTGRFQLPLNDVQRHTKLEALKCYSGPSPNGPPTWSDLLDKFGNQFDLWCESYD